MNINTQKLLAGYTSNILGITTILFSIIYVFIIYAFDYQPQGITYGTFIFTLVFTIITFYCAFVGYKNLKSLSLRRNAMFIAILNFLFFIQFIFDSWLTTTFGDYYNNLLMMILTFIITIIFGLALLRNGNNLLKISKTPHIKKIRNISLWLLLFGIITFILMFAVIAVDMISNPNTASVVESSEEVYEYMSPFSYYIAFFFAFSSIMAFGIGFLGIIYWIYLKIKK